jgi:hypothetical protein
MTPRQPGRPPLDRDDPSVSVHFRLPTKQYDDLWQRATRERVPVADFIRKRLEPPQKRVK